MNAAAMQNALTQHDRVRRSTDLPLFYAKKEKDTITAKFLIERLEAAAVVATYDDARKCNELFLTLREDALQWWKTLDNEDVNRADWEEVKGQFLAAWDPRATPRTICMNLTDLTQRSTESVQQYYLRVAAIFRKFFQIQPATDLPAIVETVPDAVDAAVADGFLEAIQLEGAVHERKITQRFVLKQIFISGLREDIRSKVMEADKETLSETLVYARDMEIILNDRKKSSNVSAIQPEAEDAPIGINEEDIEAINAVRTQQGKTPWRFNKTNQSPGRYNGNNRPYRPNNGPQRNDARQGANRCHYCGIPGHFQDQCRKRLREKGQMKYPTKIAPVQDHGTSNNANPQELGLSSLNW